MKHEFDAVIVGAGQAGPSLAARLAKAGRRVAMVERWLFGGTCVNNGCTPTKAMVASAHAAHLARRGEDFGFEAGAVTVDMRKVKARKDAIVMASRTGVEKSLRTLEGCEVFTGTASFVSATAVRVGDEVLEAKQIFLNVGARPNVPAPLFKDGEAVPYLTSTTILDLAELPEHLVVVGGGYVGLEFAQMFRRFGSRVTVIDRGERLLMHEDEDASKVMKEVLGAEGIEVRLKAECIHVEARDGGVAVGVECDEGEPHVVGSHLLLAVGRVPNTDDLGLEAAGIEKDERGYIPVNDELETRVKGIYALGDCNGRGAFTHTSYNDFEIVAENLLDGAKRRVSDRIACSSVYTDPPLARIGMAEKEVRSSGRPALVGMRPMTRVNRAVEKGELQGFMKVLVDAETDRILGATIFGTGGDEAIHSLLTAMYAGQTAKRFRQQVHIHPTVSELIPTVMGDLKQLE